MWIFPISLQLQNQLGEGSQGRVYKALRLDRRTGLQQIVAVKILHSRTVVDAWRQEFESLAKVTSLYCVRVLSFARIRGRPALVLEYVDGLSLSQIARMVDLEDDDIQEILVQIQCGLRDLQTAGTFHGDLNPSNVLVDRTGRVRLLDFGLANGNRLTPEFAAPERVALSSVGTFSGDLYSLGQIEVYLRGLNAREVGLRELRPKVRQVIADQPNDRRQKALAQRMERWIVQYELFAGAKTQIGWQNSVATTLTWRTRLLVWLIALLGVLQVPSSAEPYSARARASQKTAMLQVQTQRWHNLVLNGKPLGFAPAAVPLRAGVPHRLDWRSSRGQGTRVLVLKPGQYLHLNDRDFSH